MFVQPAGTMLPYTQQLKAAQSVYPDGGTGSLLGTGVADYRAVSMVAASRIYSLGNTLTALVE